MTYNKSILQVEYIDDQTRDFGKLYSTFEQVSFSSGPNSPMSDFKNQVSPHDPNMSSAARYSPTPVPLPSSVTELQESLSSPLITTSKSVVRINNDDYASQLNDRSSESDDSDDFTDSTNEELVTSVENELILMQGIYFFFLI